MILDGNRPFKTPEQTVPLIWSEERNMMKHTAWNPKKLDPEWPFDLFKTDFDLKPASTALVVVDMQRDQIVMRPDTRRTLVKRYPEIVRYLDHRIQSQVLPNLRKLLACFRASGRKIVYTRMGNVTSTGDEMAGRLKPHRIPQSHSRSPGYQIILSLRPRREDLIVDKLTASGFTGTFLDHALRNMGINTLVFAGVVTDACVGGTARAAAEMGYHSVICEDACATYTQRAHDEGLLAHARRFGRVGTTAEVIAEMGKRR